MRLIRYPTGLILTVGILLVFNCCKELTEQKAPPPDIQVMKVIQQDVPLQRDFVGQIYGLQDVPIRARVEGYLKRIHFEEGRPVKKGQLLYTIESQPFEAEVASMRSKMAEAHTYLINAENELVRYKPLAEINAVSKSDLDQTQASRDAAEASYQAAGANLEISRINLGYCTIYSPINGLIGKTSARAGEFVGREPNPVILNVVSRIDTTRVEFFLTEAEYIILAKEFLNLDEDEGARLKEAGPQESNLELLLADGSVYGERGSVVFIDRNVDSSTGAILVQARFANTGLLRPGMFAKVRVNFEIIENAILVPQRCVKEIQGQYSVFVVGSDNLVNEKQVVATTRFQDLWLIEEGLNPDDHVVIDGIQKVASGMEINPVVTEFKSPTKDQG